MEKTSTLISTKTTLPPNLRGPINGQIKIHVPFVTLHKNTSRNESVLVKTRWWGETSFTIFKPLNDGHSTQKDLKTIAIFHVCCSLEMILSYFNDMNLLKFEVVSNLGRISERLGLAIVDLKNVKFGAPLAGLYPIKMEDEVVGEIFVSLSLENFKTIPEKDKNEQRPETQNKVMTSLRKDTNNVLNQILTKAKDLRSCLQASGANYYNEINPNDIRTQFPIAQLLTSGSEEDFLPDDSVLNSIIYKNSNQSRPLTLKESVQTQTLNLLQVKSVETQCQCEPETVTSSRDLQIKSQNVNLNACETPTKVSSETLRDYSYLKVTVDYLNICETSLQNSGWIFSIELRIPWVGRDSAISWNNKGHRTYSDFTIFHLLSDKIKDGAIIFKQERVLPYYYSIELVEKQLSKRIYFIVEARNTQKKVMKYLGKGEILLGDVLKNNTMKLSATLNLKSDEFTSDELNSIKVVVEFLKISKKITPIDFASNLTNINSIEIKNDNTPLKVTKAQIATKSVEKVDKKVSNKMPISKETIKLEKTQVQTNNQGEELDLNQEAIKLPIFQPQISKNGNTAIILCIDRAIRLPIVYDSKRDVYYPPSTYVTCKLNDAVISTNVIQKSTHPVWNFTLRVIIENQNFIVFKIHLVNGEEIQDIEKDKILGFTTVDLRPLIDKPATDHICNFYLINNEFGEDCGELRIYICALYKHKTNAEENTHLLCKDNLENMENTSGGTCSSKLDSSGKKLKVNEFLKKSLNHFTRIKTHQS